jgi:hypothetical protein
MFLIKAHCSVKLTVFTYLACILTQESSFIFLLHKYKLCVLDYLLHTLRYTENIQNFFYVNIVTFFLWLFPNQIVSFVPVTFFPFSSWISISPDNGKLSVF